MKFMTHDMITQMRNLFVGPAKRNFCKAPLVLYNFNFPYQSWWITSVPLLVVKITRCPTFSYTNISKFYQFLLHVNGKPPSIKDERF